MEGHFLNSLLEITETPTTPQMRERQEQKPAHNVTSRERGHGRRRGARGQQLGTGQGQSQALAVRGAGLPALHLLPIAGGDPLLYLDPVVWDRKAKPGSLISATCW